VLATLRQPSDHSGISGAQMCFIPVIAEEASDLGNVKIGFVKCDSMRTVEFLNTLIAADARPSCCESGKAVTVPSDADVASNAPPGLNSNIRGESVFTNTLIVNPGGNFKDFSETGVAYPAFMRSAPGMRFFHRSGWARPLPRR